MSEIFTRKWSEISGGRFDPLSTLFSSSIALRDTKYKIINLGNIAKSFKTGFAAGKQDQTNADNGVLQIRPTNLDENSEFKFDKNIYVPQNSSIDFIKKGEVLFNNTNSQELVGKTAYFDLDLQCVCSNHITRIQTTDECLPQYLCILLNIYQKNKIFFSTCVNWNNQSGVNIELLKSYKIPLPPLAIQQQIVATMDNAYQIKKEKEQEAKEILDSIDNYLMQELGINPPNNSCNSLEQRIFTQKISHLSGTRFDPNYHQKYYQDLEKALENGKYDLVKIKTIIKNIRTGTTPHKSLNPYLQNTNIKFIRNSDLQNGEIVLDDVKLVDENLKNILIHSQKNEVLVCIAGTIGISAVNEIGEIAINQNISSLKFRKEIIPYFASYWLNSKISLKLFARNASIATILYINNPTLLNLKIPLPPLAIQEQIVSEINNRRERAKELQQEAKEVVDSAKKQVESMILGG